MEQHLSPESSLGVGEQIRNYKQSKVEITKLRSERGENTQVYELSVLVHQERVKNEITKYLHKQTNEMKTGVRVTTRFRGPGHPTPHYLDALRFTFRILGVGCLYTKIHTRETIDTRYN